MVGAVYWLNLSASKGKRGKAHEWKQVRESECVSSPTSTPFLSPVQSSDLSREVGYQDFYMKPPNFQILETILNFFPPKSGQTHQNYLWPVFCPWAKFFSLLMSMVWHSPKYLSKDYLRGAPSKPHPQGKLLLLVSVKSKPTANVSFLSFLIKKQYHYQMHSPTCHHTLKMKPKGLQLVFASSWNWVDLHQATLLTTSLCN